MDDEERRAAALDLDIARVGWGRDDPAFRQVFAARFLPDGSREDWHRFDRLQTEPAWQTFRTELDAFLSG